MKGTLGSRIQHMLDERGISRKEFAAMTGLTEAAISRYVTGQREPRAVTLAVMANALGTTTDELLGLEHDKDEMELDQAVLKVARNANDIPQDEKNRLIQALLGFADKH